MAGPGRRSRKRTGSCCLCGALHIVKCSQLTFIFLRLSTVPGQLILFKAESIPLTPLWISRLLALDAIQGNASLVSGECHVLAGNVTACTLRDSWDCLNHQLTGCGLSSPGRAITITFLLQASCGAHTTCSPSPSVVLSRCCPHQLWFFPAVVLSRCGFGTEPRDCPVVG